MSALLKLLRDDGYGTERYTYTKKDFYSVFAGSSLFRDEVLWSKPCKPQKTVKVKTDRKKKFAGNFMHFSQIPFRVIIEICSYVDLVLWNHESNIIYCRQVVVNNELDLFGYFKLDPSRTIFQIFTSVEINRSTNIVLSFKRLRALKIDNANQKVIDTVSKSSSEMRILNKLVITQNRRQNLDEQKTDLSRIFQKDSYPSLKTLSLQYDVSGNETNESDWVKSPCWRSIRRLRVIHTKSSSSTRTSELWKVFSSTDSSIGSNIHRLHFSEVLFPREVTISLPSLRSLLFQQCRNIRVTHGGKLTHLGIHRIEPKYIIELYENSPNLQGTSMSGTINYRYPNFGDTIEPIDDTRDGESDDEDTSPSTTNIGKSTIEYCLLNPNVNPLKDLKSIHLFGFKQFYGRKSQLGPKVQKATIGLCPRFCEDSFINKECPSLTNLSLSYLHDLSFSGSFVWSCLKNLKVLKLVSLDSLNDGLFQCEDHEFQFLETLAMIGLPQISGVGWKTKFPRLNDLTLRSLNIRDDLFRREGVFIELKRIRIKNCHTLTGEKWCRRSFPKLERMRLDHCSYLTDSIFKNEFQNLQMLLITVCPSIKGIGWTDQSMKKSLKMLTLHEMSRFSDACFAENHWEELLYLQITGPNECVGKEWKQMPKLEVISCYSSQNMIDGFWENKPFPESCVCDKNISVLSGV